MGGRKKINKTEVSFGRKIFLFFLFKKDKKNKSHTCSFKEEKKKKYILCVQKHPYVN